VRHEDSEYRERSEGGRYEKEEPRSAIDHIARTVFQDILHVETAEALKSQLKSFKYPQTQIEYGRTACGIGRYEGIVTDADW
jgi:hypothetical protein